MGPTGTLALNTPPRPLFIPIMLKQNLALLVVCAAVAGCSAVGAPFTPHTGLQGSQGVVYVFRPAARPLSVLTAIIKVDGKVVASLENGAYAPIPLPAGRHVITQQWKAGLLANSSFENRPLSVQLDVEEGRESYLRLGTLGSWHVAGGFPLTVQNEWEWQFRVVSATQANTELYACRLASN